MPGQPMTIPPSTGSTCPVMKLAAEGGEEIDSFCHLLGPADAAQRGLLRQSGHIPGAQMAVHIGVDHTGGHTVYPDVGGPQFLSQGPGQADDPRFRGGIGRLAGAAGDPPHGGDGDDAPRLPADKAWDRRPQDMEHPVQIGAHQLPPALCAQIGEQHLGCGNASAAYQSIQSAKGLLRGRSQGGRLLRPGDVPRDGLRADAPLPQFCRQRLRRCPGAAVVYRHIPAALGKPPGGRRSDPPDAPVISTAGCRLSLSSIRRFLLSAAASPAFSATL